MVGLGAHYEIEVACRGELGSHTGYLADIKVVDRAVRTSVCPIISRFWLHDRRCDPSVLMPSLLRALQDALPGLLAGMTWRLSPYYSIEMAAGDTRTVLLRQRFDFAAAHRLHNPALSEAENRELFGKCNLPSGHGHNYQVEPCVRVELDDKGGSKFALPALESITGRVIIDRFDHKHLNLDCPEFSLAGGVNPTVENIAKVCYGLLSPAILDAGAVLQSVTVWETDRTSCTFPA